MLNAIAHAHTPAIIARSAIGAVFPVFADVTFWSEAASADASVVCSVCAGCVTV